MAEIFVIRVAGADASETDWLAVDSSGARRGEPGHGTLAEAAAAAGDRRVQVLVPATEVLLTSADVPAKGARLLQALPFALEEQVAQDVDRLHFAAGERRSNGRIPVAVVEQEFLDTLLARLREAGMEPAGVFSEAQGLARIPGTLSALIEDDRIILNDGASMELALEGFRPGDALAAIGALDDPDEHGESVGDTADVPRHVLVYSDPEVARRHELEFQALRQQLDSLEVKLLPDGALPRLAVTVAAGGGINLLQGRYAPRSATGSLLRPWRAAAALAAALIALTLIGSGLRYAELRAEDERLRAEVVEAFRAAFPWVREVRDPRAQMNSELARLGQGGSTEQTPRQFLATLESISAAMGQTSGTRIEAISYRDGVMDIRLTAPDVATLDRLRKLVDQGGRFTARIQSTDQQEGSVRSRLQIQGAGA
ncbi:type II secretion system protein GspL [Lentisalinibacter sediminis]|uniref:type II secretion system protein GspL n=1 Tax=Lentisalinibacter sediminis TaxID=2992237 RepID=UPI003866EBE8